MQTRRYSLTKDYNDYKENGVGGRSKQHINILNTYDIVKNLVNDKKFRNYYYMLEELVLDLIVLESIKK